MLIVIALLIATAANAEPLPPQPQPKIGAVCPTGWSASPTSVYCVPGPNNKCRMMPKLGAPCLPGWSAYSTTASRTMPEAVRAGVSALGRGDHIHFWLPNQRLDHGPDQR